VTPTWVNPENLHDVWEWVKQGCEIVRRRCKTEWIAEDIYTALKQGRAHLFLIDDKGFIVLQDASGFGGKEIYVWVIYGHLAEIEDELYAWLREVKRKAGAKRVWWLSPRKWHGRKDVKRVGYLFELED